MILFKAKVINSIIASLIGSTKYTFFVNDIEKRFLHINVFKCTFNIQPSSSKNMSGIKTKRKFHFVLVDRDCDGVGLIVFVFSFRGLYRRKNASLSGKFELFFLALWGECVHLSNAFVYFKVTRCYYCLCYAC